MKINQEWILSVWLCIHLVFQNEYIYISWWLSNKHFIYLFFCFISWDTYLNFRALFFWVSRFVCCVFCPVPMPTHIKSQVLHFKSVIPFHPSTSFSNYSNRFLFYAHLWHFAWCFWCRKWKSTSTASEAGISMLPHFNTSTHSLSLPPLVLSFEKERKKEYDNNTKCVCVLNNAMETIVNAMNPTHLFKSVKSLQWWYCLVLS